MLEGFEKSGRILQNSDAFIKIRPPTSIFVGKGRKLTKLSDLVATTFIRNMCTIRMKSLSYHDVVVERVAVAGKIKNRPPTSSRIQLLRTSNYFT